MSLKNMLKNGMIAKYRNGDNNFYSNGVFLDNSFDVCNHIDNYTDDLKALYNATGNLDIVKIYDPNEFGLKLVWERCDRILTEKEKEYLSNIIKPFKEKVKDITKYKFSAPNTDEFIGIMLNNKEYICFPSFEQNSMYKEMEINKRYTLEELGL